MPSEGSRLLERGVLPDDDFVVGVAVGADDFLGIFRKHKVADLRASVNAVQQRPVEGVPEFDSFVS